MVLCFLKNTMHEKKQFLLKSLKYILIVSSIRKRLLMNFKNKVLISFKYWKL